MTISTHVYSAVLIGTPDRALSLRGGSVTLDAGTAPHVQGRITIASPGAWTVEPDVVVGGEIVFYGGPVWTADPDLLDALDPRLTQTPRVRIEVDGVFPSFSQHREFDVCIRDRNAPQTGGTVSLTLASDEALLGDYRPLADDLTPFDHQSSLRDVIDYVLDAVMPGAQLEVSPAIDADMTTYTDAENLFRDPRLFAIPGAAAVTAIGCTVAREGTWPGTIGGVTHWSAWLHTPTSSDSYVYVLPTGTMNGLRIGGTYVLSATGRTHIAQGGTLHARARRLVVFMDVGGYIETQSAAFPSTVGVDGRVSVEFTVPEGCREVFARAYHGATSGEVKWSQPRLSEKSKHPRVDDKVYFHGGQTDTAEYDYAWIGDANVSGSRRRALVDRSPEMLVWKAGQSALDYLHPLLQVHGYRLVCDEQRQWTLRDENYTAPGALSIRHGVNLIDGEDSISRDSGLSFHAAIARYKWVDREGATQERIDSFALPGATLGVEFNFTTPYPGPGFAEYAVRRSQGRGREVTATVVSNWGAHAEQPIAVVLAGAPIQVGLTQRVTFDFDGDEMSVLTRTTDTPVDAWVLIPDDETWLDQPAGESWIDEVV